MNRNKQHIIQPQPQIAPKTPYLYHTSSQNSQYQPIDTSLYSNTNINNNNNNSIPLRQAQVGKQENPHMSVKSSIISSLNNFTVGRNRQNTRKIYFTYFGPEYTRYKQEIQTFQQEPDKPLTNQWEIKYFQLQKKMDEIFIQNQKMAEQFMKMRDSLKNQQDEKKKIWESWMEDKKNLQEFCQQIQDSWIEDRKKFDDQKSKLQQQIKRLLQESANIYQQNRTIQQQNLLLQQNIRKVQQELKKYEQDITRLQQQKRKSQELYQQQINQQNQKSSAIQEQLKMIRNQNQKLYEKNNQILTEFQMERNDNIQKTLKIKQYKQKIQKLQKKIADKMNQQKFQERLTKIRIQYEKKQKKLQKLLEQKTRQIIDLRDQIVQLQENQRNSKDISTNYQKLYLEKKQQINNLKKLLQENNSAVQGNQLAFYQKKYYQISQIAKQQAQKIKKLQKQKQNLQILLNKYQQDFSSQQKLNNIQRAFQQAKDKVLQKGGMAFDEVANQVTTYYNGKIFQQKLLYQLKNQNQKLKQALCRLNFNPLNNNINININKLSNMNIINSGRNSPIYSNYTYNYSSPVKNVESGQLFLILKKIITDTYTKLQNMINQINISTNQYQYSQQSKSRSTPPKISKQLQRYKQKQKLKSKLKQQQKRFQNKKNKQSLKQSNITKYTSPNSPELSHIHQNLYVLKLYIFDINQTFNKLIIRLQKQQMENKIKQRQNKKIKFNQEILSAMVPKQAELLEFYKNKNKQLEERIDQLINLNQLFKEKLIDGPTHTQSQIQAQGQGSGRVTLRSQKSTQRQTSPSSKINIEYFYQNQLKMSKNKIQELQQKHKKLIQKYKILQHQKQQTQNRLILEQIQTKKHLKSLQQNIVQISTIPELNKNIQEIKLQKYKIQQDYAYVNNKLQLSLGKIQEFGKILNSRDGQIRMYKEEIGKLNFLVGQYQNLNKNNNINNIYTSRALSQSKPLTLQAQQPNPTIKQALKNLTTSPIATLNLDFNSAERHHPNNTSDNANNFNIPSNQNPTLSPNINSNLNANMNSITNRQFNQLISKPNLIRISQF